MGMAAAPGAPGGLRRDPALAVAWT
jgi:hypothetical protein